MDSYNESVINHINDFLKYVLSRLSAKDERGRSLNLVDYKVIDDSIYELGDLISEERTYSMLVEYTISCNDPKGGHSLFKKTIEVPKSNNGLFIINGKQRIGKYILDKDGECAVYPTEIVIDSLRKFRWNFPKGVTPGWKPEFFYFDGSDADGNRLKFDLNEENLINFRDLLVLTPYQIKKLKVKLNMDEVAEHIGMPLIQKLYEKGPDAKYDSIIDKVISTIESNLRSSLFSRSNLSTVISRMGNSFYNKDDISLESLQSVIMAYFTRVSENDCIEVPSSINPLIYDTLKSKVKIPDYMVYNESFTDLIDTANTPENNNVNIINELNVCTSVEGGTIYYICYDFKTGAKLKLEYLDYLNKKVLKCDYYDYDNHKVKDFDEYIYTHRLIQHRIPKSELKLAGIELVEPSPDERLSLASRRIPLINLSDSVRVAMGAAMIRQSIYTLGCEPRLVASGNDKEDIVNSSNLIKSPVSGTVTEITSDKIVIEDETSGLPIVMTIPKSVVSNNKTTTPYKPFIKEGQKVVANQVLEAPASMELDSYNTGINARAVYMSYLGLTYEDGVVISESYSKRAAHITSYEVQVHVKYTDKLRSIKQVGSRVDSSTQLVTMLSKNPHSKTLERAIAKGKTDTIFQIIDITNKSNGVGVPNNISEGYITDIKIIDGPRECTDETKNKIKEWQELGRSTDTVTIPAEFMELKASSDIDPLPTDCMIISFRIVARCNMQIGDKSSNSWGSKGIISLVLPDELMPRLDLDGHGNGPAFDIIMNPGAPTARKNPSQIYECAISKCIEAVYNACVTKVNEAIQAANSSNPNEEKKLVEEAKEMTKMMYGDKFTKMSTADFEDACRKITNFSLNVGSFSKIPYDTLLSWMKELGVHEKQLIYCPDVVIYQDDDFSVNKDRGRRACSPEYAKDHGIHGKLYELGFVEEPVLTGISYMYKLYHSAAFAGKVSPEKPSVDGPLMHKGLYRDGGQKIGEMESWMLRARGVQQFITDNNPAIRDEENVFFNHMFLTGFMITDDLGVPIQSRVIKKVK